MFDPINPDIPVGEWIADGIDYITDAWDGFFDIVKDVLATLHEQLLSVLAGPPYWVMMLVFAAIAYLVGSHRSSLKVGKTSVPVLVGSWRLALFSLIGFYVIRGMDVWEHSMDTIALVIVAVALALLIAIPLGILASKVTWVSRVLRPILDLMQTMPALVYLVPAITIFSVGVVPGAIATVIFAMPPGVRLTELALRQVDEELVEAGQAFGATGWRILWQIQIPVAMKTIMAGVNQVIMLALSMVVLAGMAGAGGLGGEVVGSLSSLNVPQGMGAGVAVVIIAIWLDRVSNSLSDRRPRTKKAPTTGPDDADESSEQTEHAEQGAA